MDFINFKPPFLSLSIAILEVLKIALKKKWKKNILLYAIIGRIPS